MAESNEFVWIPRPSSMDIFKGDDSLSSYHFLKEGYMKTKIYDRRMRSSSSSTMKRTFGTIIRRFSDPSDPSTRLGNWARRWCVLSDTPNGTHLLLYKDKSSFSNFELPCTVLPLNKCLKLTSFPSHAKSENMFGLTFDEKEILFYTNTSSELDEWLQVLQDTLNMVDSYCHSPLKGLPKQKALRKEWLYNLHDDTEEDLNQKPSNITATETPLLLEGVDDTSSVDCSESKGSSLLFVDKNINSEEEIVQDYLHHSQTIDLKH